MSLPPTVLVTGSSRGLGRGVAEVLAAAGYSVAIHYANNADAAKQTAEACGQLAPNSAQQFPVVGGNVGLDADRRRLFDQTLEAFGHLDSLVNNAGIAPRVRADITEATEEIFDEVIAVNLKGPYFLSQLAARYWLANPGKCRLDSGYKLIFVSSLSANTASINRGEYCISKAAVAMATKLWAVRLAGEGIAVYELRPGVIRSDMTGPVTEKYDKLIADGLTLQKRWGLPEDIGKAVCMLLGGALAYSTGQVIQIDGGLTVERF